MSNGNEISPYTVPQELAQYSEQIRQVASSAIPTHGQPVVLNIHLPVQPPPAHSADVPGSARKGVDWTALAIFGFPSLIVLVISSYIFVGCMSQPPPPPPTVVHRSTPSCLFLC